MRDFKKPGLGNGTTSIDVSDTLRGSKSMNYGIQFTCKDAAGAVAVPAAGTCTIKAAIGQNLPAEDLYAGAVDLTDRTKWLQTLKSESVFTFDFVVASLTSGYTVDILIRPALAA